MTLEYADLIRLIDVKTDDISDYKETSILLVFPTCTFKCKNCQNAKLIKDRHNLRFYSVDAIVDLYNNSKLHKAIVCAGLEPFDSFDSLFTLFKNVLNKTNKEKTDFVIYTGYNQEDILEEVNILINKLFKIKSPIFNLIIKFGPYDEKYLVEDKKKDPILGVSLATSNQYVVKYTNEKEEA